MNKTKIEWCDMTFNPVTGCLHGCSYCYANTIAQRFGLSFAPKLGDPGMEGASKYDSPEGMDTMLELEKPYISGGRIQPYPMAFLPTFHRYRLDEPQRVKKPQTIFVCSMADLFGEWVPDGWIEQVFQACYQAPWHRYLFLTKNPGRYAEAVDYLENRVPDYVEDLTEMWFGATVTNNAHLTAAYDSAATWLSIEPILEKIETDEWFTAYRRGDDAEMARWLWVVIGTETGNRKERIVPQRAWIAEIVDACRSAGTPVFMKNSLRPIWGEELIREFPWDVVREGTIKV